MPKQIKQEELQEFWEWCGLTFLRDRDRTLSWYDSEENFVDFGFPDIDLNNLFKYAMPKTVEKLQGTEPLHFSPETALRALFSHWLEDPHAVLETPALALYQAIQKARRTNEQD